MNKYTIAICNYNMADTLEESLRSILDQIDERFEVLVVDDDSSDGSIQILKELKKEYNILEYFIENNENIGEARKSANEKANGEYILTQLDADDKYFDNVILDFIEIFHQIERQVDFDFYLSGGGINMAKKDLLLEVPYRSLGYGEDRDLWRRLIAKDSIIWLEHNPAFETIGYEPGIVDGFKNSLEIKTVDFQVGISFWSCIKWSLNNRSFAKLIFDLITYPLAFFISRTKNNYDPPEPKEKFKKRGVLEKEITNLSKTLSEIEDHYDIKINRNKLSKEGQQIFDI